MLLELGTAEPVTRAELSVLSPWSWPKYRKRVLTSAVRVRGPFRVKTSEDVEGHEFRCEDGYLAVDARGYPYAIAREEFELIYEPMPPEAE